MRSACKFIPGEQRKKNKPGDSVQPATRLIVPRVKKMLGFQRVMKLPSDKEV